MAEYPKKLYRTVSDFVNANSAQREAELRGQGYVSEAEFRAPKTPAVTPPVDPTFQLGEPRKKGKK